MAYPIIKEADFRRALKNAPTGGYLFFGEEDYMKSAALRMARAGIAEADPAMACFNDIRLDSTTFTPGGLLDAMSVPPMGSDRKLISITGINLGSLRAAELDKLGEALSAMADYPYNLVILSADADALDAGTLPKRPSELFTTLAEYLHPVCFERNTPAKLLGWVQKHYAHNGVAAAAEICQFTVDFCGRNMFTLAGEIDKVSFYVLAKSGTVVTTEDVRLSAIPAMEYDAFAFTNAIMEQRRTDALDILIDLKFRRVEPLYILSEVSRVVCDLLTVRTMADGGQSAAEISTALKMHEYRVKLYLKQARNAEPARLRAAVAACGTADRALKRASGDGYGVIERLICGL